MLDFLQGWILYPISETIHALQGILAGYLGARSIYKSQTSDAICALLITLAFAIYEITEQWKIDDSAYQDFENFWVTAVGTGLIYFLIIFISKKVKNDQTKH